MTLSCIAVAFLLAASPACPADATSDRRYPLPERGYLQVQAPASWKDERRQPSEPVPPTILFGPGRGTSFAVLLTPIWRPRPDVPLPAKAELRQRVERAAESIRPQAVEKRIDVVEFQGSSGPGFYFSATDKAPKPGEYKFMTQGILSVAELLVTFTILTNDGRDAIVRDALEMLKSASHASK
jgi:hypothetical protein